MIAFSFKVRLRIRVKTISINAATSRGLAHAAPIRRRTKTVEATRTSARPKKGHAGVIFSASTTILYSQVSKKPVRRSNQHQAALTGVLRKPARLKVMLTVRRSPSYCKQFRYRLPACHENKRRVGRDAIRSKQELEE